MKCSPKTMLKIGLVSAGILGGGFLVFPQFRPVILGLAPFALFALCPISMLFAMRGMNPVREKSLQATEVAPKGAAFSNGVNQDEPNVYENETTERRSIKSNWLLPISILVSGLLIAGAVVYSTGKNALRQETANSGKASDLRESPPPTFGSGSAENIKPINDQDHILGNPDAPVKVIEFADTECPFCKRFHSMMRQLIQEYGRSGQVAWVYRHFPLDQIHSKARKEAQALECANELGGNAKFWEYIDRLYEISPSNDNLDLSLLPKIAEEVGLNQTQFQSCLSGDARGGKYADHIEADYQDAVASGGNGTPYSIVIAPNGQKFPISGAQPYSAVKQVVEAALKLK